ncbi:MAG: hypothetical protein ACRC2H_09985 [Silanimonas sp.]
MSTPDNAPQIIARGPNGENFGDSPYARDAQMFVVGVHGTNNGPGDVREITERIAGSLDHITTGRVEVNTGFSWEGRNGTFNQPGGRGDVARDFADHVLRAVDEGRFRRDQPLIIVPVGFSHGGNVAIQATEQIAEGLRARNFNGGIHMVSLSTPAYNDNGPESPTQARQAAANNGVTYRQDHFSVAGDGVVDAAVSNNHYISGYFVTNHDMAAVSRWDGIANHGAPQNSETHMRIIQREVQESFRELTPGLRRSSALPGEEGSVVATNPRAEFERNPVVASVQRGLGESGAREPADASTVAAIAAAAYERFPDGRIGGVALSNDGRSAFLVAAGQRLDDPAAERHHVSLEGAAQKPFDEAWRQTAQAITAANERQSTVAAVEPELARPQARSAGLA